MANFKYTTTTQTQMTVKGFIDSKNLTIDVDGQVKNLNTLLSDFDGGFIEMVVKVKDSYDNDEPTETDDDSDEE